MVDQSRSGDPSRTVLHRGTEFAFHASRGLLLVWLSSYLFICRARPLFAAFFRSKWGRSTDEHSGANESPVCFPANPSSQAELELHRNRTKLAISVMQIFCPHCWGRRVPYCAHALRRCLMAKPSDDAVTPSTTRRMANTGHGESYLRALSANTRRINRMREGSEKKLCSTSFSKSVAVCLADSSVNSSIVTRFEALATKNETLISNNDLKYRAKAKKYSRYPAKLCANC